MVAHVVDLGGEIMLKVQPDDTEALWWTRVEWAQFLEDVKAGNYDEVR